MNATSQDLKELLLGRLAANLARGGMSQDDVLRAIGAVSGALTVSAPVQIVSEKERV